MDGLRRSVPALWKLTRRLGANTCCGPPRRQRPNFTPRLQAVARCTHAVLRPHAVPRRHCDMRRLCTAWAAYNLGPLGHFILCARISARVRAFKTNRSCAISFAGTKQDTGTLFQHRRVADLRVRRDDGRINQFSLGDKEFHYYPHRGLPSCRRSRGQRCFPLCPRTICILARKGCKAPISLVWDL